MILEVVLRRVRQSKRDARVRSSVNLGPLKVSVFGDPFVEQRYRRWRGIDWVLKLLSGES